MSANGQSDTGTALATGVLTSLPGVVVGAWLPAFFPLAPIWLRLVVGICIAASVWYLLRKRISRGLADIFQNVRRRPYLTAGVSGLVIVLLVLTAVGIIAVQPELRVDKRTIACTQLDPLVDLLCNVRTPDFMVIAITVTSEHPLVALPIATLTDKLTQKPGPTYLQDQAIVSGTETFSGQTRITVPLDRWLVYYPGSTIEFDPNTMSDLVIPDSPSGQGHLFTGLNLGSVPQELNFLRQPFAEFAYLAQLVPAPKTGEDTAITGSVERLSLQQTFTSPVNAAVGDILRIRLDLSNTTSQLIQDAVVTTRLPAQTSTSLTMTSSLMTGLPTASNVITINVPSGAYLNYRPETTKVEIGTEPSAQVPDARGVGALFTPEGVSTVLLADSAVHTYLYFDLEVAKQPKPAFFAPTWLS